MSPARGFGEFAPRRPDTLEGCSEGGKGPKVGAWGGGSSLKDTRFAAMLVFFLALAVFAVMGMEFLPGDSRHVSPSKPPPSASASGAMRAELQSLVAVQRALTKAVDLYGSLINSGQASLAAQDVWEEIQESHQIDVLVLGAQISDGHGPSRALLEAVAPARLPANSTHAAREAAALAVEEEISEACRAALSRVADEATKRLLREVDSNSSRASRSLREMN